MINNNKIGNEILKKLYLQKELTNNINILVDKNMQKYIIILGFFNIKIKKHNIILFKDINKIIEMIEGLNKGFFIHLELVGVGFKAAVKNSILSLRLGRVLDNIFIIPKNICIFIIKSVQIFIFGTDKMEVSQVAHKIRSLKIPDIFKGKGIRYYSENLKLKESKKKKK